MSKLWKFTLFALACSLARTPSSLAQAPPNGPPAYATLAAVTPALPSPQNPPDSKSTEFNLEPIETPPATYPPQAQQQKVQGKVTARFLLSGSGDVEYVDVPKDQPLLDVAAQEAIVKWKFKPVIKDGKPAAVIASATFNFVLGSDGSSPKDVTQQIGTASVFPERVQLPKAVAKSAMVHHVPAVYPQGAVAMRVEGAVVLQARIDKDGKIADLQLVSGPRQLVQAAMDAVKQYRYKPYSLMGQLVGVETQVQVDFSLAGGY
jgi:TonB family protein